MYFSYSVEPCIMCVTVYVLQYNLYVYGAPLYNIGLHLYPAIFEIYKSYICVFFYLSPKTTT